MKPSRRIIIAGALAVVLLLSVAAYSAKFREPSGGPYFYVTILKALYGTVDSGLYRFSLSDFSEAGTGGFDDAFIRDRKFIDFGLGNDFVPRKICSYEDSKLVA
ncbi:MAG: hypothetical protein QG650_136 [Patescibacteria group bacterium]|nr:hypothetical protein [Patescibacteria group bacterium]